MVIQKSSIPEEFANEQESAEQRKLKIKSIYREAEEKETEAKAKGLGYDYLDLSIIPIEAEALKLIPPAEAQKAQMAVIHKTGKKLHIASYDPESAESQKIIKGLDEEGYDISLIMASRSSLERAWENYDPDSGAKPETGKEINISEKELSDFEKSLADLNRFAERIISSPVSETLNIIMAGAIKTGSSDIHLEPAADSVRLRYRIDGILRDMAVFPKKIYAPFLNRVKMIGRLKLNVSGVPQNGRFSLSVGNEAIDIRLALLPGVYGDDIVMRLLYQSTASLKLEQIGLSPEMMKIVNHELAKPSGMILVTGPTGSGKTTTLYAFLNLLNEPGTKIITIEDPVEYKIAGIAQTAVNPEGGYTFATGLAAIMRQDPDIIMVGEMRDPDTASTGVQAALTGHLVFSTLHTNNAPGAIPRLIELGIRPSLIPSSTNIIIGQRLVRRLCPFCKEKKAASPEIIKKMRLALSAISPKAKIKPPEKIEYIWKARGCPKCNSGYKGRIGIFEIFSISPKIERLILEMAPATEIVKAAKEEGMTTIGQDGLFKALEGITAIEEVERAAGEM